MNVTIFGGAQPKEGTPAYQEAYELGKLLAQNGHTILTGGYMGTMEAASRGANEAGGHVIGVTCEDIEVWRTSTPNPWIIEERRHKTLQARLNGLIEGCDAAIALPGGAGTLAEIALMWNRMIISAIPPIPLILVGDGWRAVLGEMYTSLGDYVPPQQRQFISFAPTVGDAAAFLQNQPES